MGGRRVTGAHGDTQPRIGVPQPGGFLPDLAQGDVQVLVDVDRESTERGDVEHLGQATLTGPGLRSPVGGVDGHQESGQRLPGTGG